MVDSTGDRLIPFAHLPSLLRGCLDPVAVIDCGGAFPVLTRARREFLATLVPEGGATEATVLDALSEPAWQAWSAAVDEATRTAQPTRAELVLDEQILDADFVPVVEGTGVSFIMVSLRPSTTVASLVNAIDAGVCLLGRSLAIRSASPAMARLLDVSLDELIGRRIASVVAPKDHETLRELLAAAPSGADACAELSLVDRASRELDVTMAIGTLGSGPDLYVVLANEHAAPPIAMPQESTPGRHDDVTGLPSRSLMLEKLAAEARRLAPAVAAATVLFVDLDDFKRINDVHGHACGDDVLRQVAARFVQAAPPRTMVARIGGDEFIAANIGTRDGPPEDLAAAFMAVFDKPLVVEGRDMEITASAGLAHSDDVREGIDDLVKQADVAMYESKRMGKARVTVFDDELASQKAERNEIAREMLGVIERGELELHYQPIIDVVTGRPLSTEALLRWHHPVRGMVSPAVFVPIAEDTGLISDIGTWVLDEAVRQTAEWNEARLTRRSLGVSVNISGRQLDDPGILDTVRTSLSRWGLDPGRLTLEITESIMMSDVAVVTERLLGLRRLGAKLAIDDFGTGYSSLAYLKRFPATTLKVDRAFVEGLGIVQEDTALVTGIIGLANALDMQVVAEGVENDRQLRELRRLGCEYTQGFHFARPMAAADFEYWVSHRQDSGLVSEKASTTG